MDPHFRFTRDGRNDYQQKFTVCALPFFKAIIVILGSDDVMTLIRLKMLTM